MQLIAGMVMSTRSVAICVPYVLSAIVQRLKTAHVTGLTRHSYRQSLIEPVMRSALTPNAPGKRSACSLGSNPRWAVMCG